jgi:hypothetical protein
MPPVVLPSCAPPGGLAAQRCRLLEESVDLGEGRGCLERPEDVTGLAERLCGVGRAAEGGEAAALAEERERLLWDNPELAPAVGGLSVALCCWEVALGFGENGVRGGEGVFGLRVGGFDPGHQPQGQPVIAEAGRCAYQCGQDRVVV